MALLGCLCPGALASGPVTYEFQWVGGGGYTMRGAMAYDASRIEGPLVTAEDVTCFVINGALNGAPIGRWALGQLTEETTWVLTFLPEQSAFVTYRPLFPMPQAWNMDGEGRNCGPGGFGFNIGNAAQDLCLDGQLLFESQVHPSSPLGAWRNDSYLFDGDACLPPPMLSLLTD